MELVLADIHLSLDDAEHWLCDELGRERFTDIECDVMFWIEELICIFHRGPVWLPP